MSSKYILDIIHNDTKKCAYLLYRKLDGCMCGVLCNLGFSFFCIFAKVVIESHLCFM